MLKITCSLLVFIYSLYVGPFATGGDQTSYREIYEQMGKMSFEEAILFYFRSLNSKEIVHLGFSYIFSSNSSDRFFMTKSFVIFILVVEFSVVISNFTDVSKLYLVVVPEVFFD